MMTEQTKNITQMTEMAAQLRSLSLDPDKEPAAAAARDGSGDAEGGGRPHARRWRWAAAAVLGLAGAAGGLLASDIGPGRVLARFLPSADAPQVVSGQPAAAPAAGPAPAAMPAAVPAAAAPAVPVRRQIIGSGYSRAEMDVVLSAPLPGRILAVDTAEGDQVSAGTPLLRMEDRAAQEALERALLDLKQAQLAAKAADLSLRQLQEDQARLQKLADRGAAPVVQLRTTAHEVSAAVLDQEIADLAVQSAEAALRAARADLADYVLSAPFSGTVAALSAQPGMVAEGEQHDALLRLFNPSSLVVDVDIAERSLSQIHDGQAAEVVFDAWPDQSFAGHVSAITPILSRERGTLRVVIALDRIPPELRPNMAARAILRIAGPGDEPTNQIDEKQG
ncbi:efflux RND transporter periplasmic adaptor subunit [Leisingera thetidis]|uniref:efflux RND transporter periplasmic adaptor subunit n=1 Tax=Leisingera thetidis TaxID=2930199 RepID=UPI0021F7B0C1|nr:efflux RND transporter periplasmic adaptor subunit [Leisingera thetidis]